MRPGPRHTAPDATPAGSRTSADRPLPRRVDVACLGESMALITPDPPGPPAHGGPARIDVAGAESTVACYLAQLGAQTAWVSRVGDDPALSPSCAELIAAPRVTGDVATLPRHVTDATRQMTGDVPTQKEI